MPTGQMLSVAQAKALSKAYTKVEAQQVKVDADYRAKRDAELQTARGASEDTSMRWVRSEFGDENAVGAMTRMNDAMKTDFDPTIALSCSQTKLSPSAYCLD
jgi:hypothetical protein